jgi:hypothetical protein
LSRDAAIRIPVGVVVEREKAKSKWVEYVWRPVAVLIGAPETEPWTQLTDEGGTATFYAGGACIELFPTETTYYRDNVASGRPLLWVALRRTGGTRPYELFKVTADPAEGEAMTETGTDLVETVTMPNAIREQIVDYIAKYHVERPFIKRKRDRADPEALSRKSPRKENEG